MRFSFQVAKIFSGALFLCLIVMAGTCKKKNKNAPNLNVSMLQKTWLHSQEEDRGDTLVYRPNSYNFPPARGRTGFTLEPDGTFRQYDIAPTDGLEENPGKWQLRDDKFLDITFPTKKAAPFEVEVISAQPEMLKVIKRFK